VEPRLSRQLACSARAAGDPHRQGTDSIEGGHVVGGRVKKNDEGARKGDADTSRRVKQ